MEVTARAPGKVILSGEHAVVHGSAAVASSINLYKTLRVHHPASPSASRRRPPPPFKLDEEIIEHFDVDLLCSRKGNFQRLVKHLKRVEIIDFAYGFESKHLLALIKFLLGDALALEKMIIKADLHAQHVKKRLRDIDLCELLGISRNVLSYRRASQNAEVIFDYPLEEASFEKHQKKILVSKRG